MLKAVIDASLSNRVVVLVLALFVAWGGVLAVRSMPLEAIPDLSDVQVIVQTDVPGQNPRIVEDQVTYPIASELLKVPGARTVRAFSFFESSFVYVIFDDGTDLYWARSRVLEVLSSLRGRLPAGAEPTLGPDATGLGWVYQYALVDETGTRSLAELRAYQDWTLRYQLAAVPGVSEVATVGGYEQVYEVQVDPAKLRAYGIPVTRVMDALRGSNEDAGAMVLEMAEREYMIRGLGYLQGLDDIGRVVVSASERGAPVRVSDVATVRLAPDVRRGVADLDGLGEVVGGIVVMRFGENALATIERVKEKVASLEGSLPEGLAIRPVYDRSDLILRAVATLREKLVEESLVVALVVVLFLFHLRSSLVILLTLPLGILIAFIAMRALGLSADIMSLGGIAIAIGAMIDAAIVMVENLHKHLERAIGEKRAAAGASADPRPLHTDELTGEERWALVGRAAKEVGPALFFTLLVITVSFLPVFALEAQEGRLFKPLAWTKTLAMAGAAFVSITVVPVAMGLLVRGRIQREDSNPLNRVLIAGYLPVLRFVLRWRWPVAAAALAAVILTVLPARRIGSEFMPPLDEGTLLYMPTTLPGIGVAKAASTLRMQDSILASFPEVESVFGKAGRAETATDPAPLDMFETTLVLKPRNTWRPGMTPDSLVAEMDAAVRTAGVVNSWTMPIQGRIDMLATGIRTPVGVKIFGPDLATLERLAREVEEAVRMVPGTRSAFGERVQSGSYVDIEIDRDAAARYGLNVGQIQAVISSAVGGMALTTAVEGRERYAVRVRYPQELRDTPERLAEVLVPVGERRAAPQPGAGLAAGPIPGGPGLGGAPGGGRAGTDGGAGGGGGMAGMASGGMGGASSGGMGGLAGSAGAAGAAMGGAIPSALPGTPQIPLGMVARIRTVAGPMAIKTEQAFPTAWVTIDTDARDLGAYVAAAQDMVDEMVTLPAGYSLAWSGQYEAMERARERMAVVIPATLLIIFMLLYMSFGRLGETLIVLLSLPFALVGGVLFMAWMGFNWSVATAVGFIALAGVAAETGVVMLLYLDHAWRARLEAGKRTLEDLREAVLEGAALRLRPKMMTVLTVITGLLPLYWGDGTGASVMRRIAAPMVGGMVSALVLTLVVIPALYSLWMEVRLAREARHGSGSEPGRGRG